jgi:hypothetical protein
VQDIIDINGFVMKVKQAGTIQHSQVKLHDVESQKSYIEGTFLAH